MNRGPPGPKPGALPAAPHPVVGMGSMSSYYKLYITILQVINIYLLSSLNLSMVSIMPSKSLASNSSASVSSMIFVGFERGGATKRNECLSLRRRSEVEFAPTTGCGAVGSAHGLGP